MKPVMFKTVYNGRERFVWQLRRMVFRLKLFDLVLYQSDLWSKKYSDRAGPTNQAFLSSCVDTIPMAHVDKKILELFGKVKTSD